MNYQLKPMKCWLISKIEKCSELDGKKLKEYDFLYINDSNRSNFYGKDTDNVSLILKSKFLYHPE